MECVRLGVYILGDKGNVISCYVLDLEELAGTELGFKVFGGGGVLLNFKTSINILILYIWTDIWSCWLILILSIAISQNVVQWFLENRILVMAFNLFVFFKKSNIVVDFLIIYESYKSYINYKDTFYIYDFLTCKWWENQCLFGLVWV